MKKLVPLSFFILLSINLFSQFSFIDAIRPATNLTNTVPDSNTVFSTNSNRTRIIRYNINSATYDSMLISNAPNVFSIDGGVVIDNQTFFLLIKESQNSTSTTYLVQNYGATWTKITNPRNTPLLPSAIDHSTKNLYFDYGFYTKYVFNFSNIKWDSITGQSDVYDILKMENGNGILRTAQLVSPFQNKVATTSNGAKTYQILTNIDYNSPPFSRTKNGMLQKLIIVTDSFWIAQHIFDSTTLNQISRVYYTTDKGSSWKILFNFGVKSFVVAGKSTVYVTKQVGPLGDLYQVSNSGSKVCLTNFKGVVSEMYYWNSDRGIILTADTPNKQPGLWRVTNGGGAPCIIAGINDKNIQSNLITLYPNPANNQITVAKYSLPQNSEYRIYNILGMFMQHGVLDEKETIIKINNLPSGLYFIRVGDTTLKFVKGKD